MPAGPDGRAAAGTVPPARETSGSRLRFRSSSLLRTLPRPWTVFGVVRETLLPGEWQELTGYARVPDASGPT